MIITFEKMLVLFNKKPVYGVYLQERPEVYRLSEKNFLVEYKGKQFVGDDSLDQLYTNINVNGLEQLKYVGTEKNEEMHNLACHFYLSDRELFSKKRGLIIPENEYGEIAYFDFIDYKQIQGVEFFTDLNVYTKENYCFVRVGDYAIVNINTGEIIYVKGVDFVDEKYIEQAIESNRLEFLKKLSELCYDGVDYFGRYNLRRISSAKVSLEDLWQEAQKVEVKEMLFNGYSWAVYNLVKALNYKNQVEDWGMQFSNYKVIVRYKHEIEIFRGDTKLANFNNKLVWLGREDKVIHDLCYKYSLCNKQLSKAGLKKWAGFLKSCKIEWVEYR